MRSPRKTLPSFLKSWPIRRMRMVSSLMFLSSTDWSARPKLISWLELIYSVPLLLRRRKEKNNSLLIKQLKHLCKTRNNFGVNTDSTMGKKISIFFSKSVTSTTNKQFSSLTNTLWKKKQQQFIIDKIMIYFQPKLCEKMHVFCNFCVSPGVKILICKNVLMLFFQFWN